MTESERNFIADLAEINKAGIDRFVETRDYKEAHEYIARRSDLLRREYDQAEKMDRLRNLINTGKP